MSKTLQMKKLVSLVSGLYEREVEVAESRLLAN
jgi:hypothetical protein